MKKTMKMMLALMAGAMAFTACSNEDMLENNPENNAVVETPSQLKPMTFTAIQEGQTRAAIDGLDIKWTANDKISIFDGSNAYGGDQMFTIENGVGTTSATFTGSAAPADTYYALYPYTVGETMIPVTKADALAAFGQDEMEFEMEVEDMWKRYSNRDLSMAEQRVKDNLDMYGVSAEKQAIIFAYLKGESITTPGVQLDGSSIKGVVIPAEQTATAGSADPNAMIMVAQGNDKDALEFKNVCAYVKVTPKFNCAAICLKSKGAQNLAGKIDINYNAGEPTTTVTADGTKEVYLVGDITADNAYYIAVRPEALASGFTIEFLTADKTTYYARSTNNALALARSNVKNVGEFATSGTWSNTLTVSGTDNGHTWAMLSLGGIKMATSMANATAVSYANITSWGDGWVLPTYDEFSDLYDKGLLDAHDLKVKLRGDGILKYVVNVDLTINARWLWTSTIGKEAANYSNSGRVVPWNKTYSDASNISPAIYKYNN